LLLQKKLYFGKSEGPLTAENPFYMSLHTYHLSDFEGTILLLALCDLHFFFLVTVKKAAHRLLQKLSIKSVICLRLGSFVWITSVRS